MLRLGFSQDRNPALRGFSQDRNPPATGLDGAEDRHPPATPSAAPSFRDDAVGPGIQTVWVMPWEGSDTDAVCIGTASYLGWDGLFPPGLDSIHPTGQQVVRRGPDGSPALKHLRPE